VNARNKGVRGELEFRDFLREAGIDAQRGQQHKGGPGSPDVLTALDERVHFEVKRTEKLRLQEAMAQAYNDADPSQIPVVVTRRNRGEWLAILPARYLVRLFAELDGGM